MNNTIVSFKSSKWRLHTKSIDMKKIPIEAMKSIMELLQNYEVKVFVIWS